jgi:hypothetical protein
MAGMSMLTVIPGLAEGESPESMAAEVFMVSGPRLRRDRNDADVKL